MSVTSVRDPRREADRASFERRTSRRTFLGATPVMAAAMGMPQESGAPPERIPEDALACAEELSGLAFTDEERELPEAVLVAGPLHEEGTVAQVARAYERATEWNDRHPPMA